MARMDARHPGGRPTDYSDETAATICQRLADGESLRSICSDADMPVQSTVFRWLSLHDEFSKQYAYARASQAEYLFDEILDIADDGHNDWMLRKFGDDERYVENGEALRRSVLRVDARKWVVSKLLPKKYGERVTSVVEGGDKPVQIENATAQRRRAAAALLLARKDDAE